MYRTLLGWFFTLAFTLPLAAQEPIRFGRSPDISPDGRQIAFSYLGDLWIVDAIGGVARPVTTHEAHDTDPVFSPDGRHLAFSSNRHGNYCVFVVPTHGGRPKRLTFDSADARVCNWTPDGQKVVFSSARGGSYPMVTELYTVPIAGGREERLSAFEGRAGALSPDGQKLAYVRGPGTWYRKNYRGSSNDDLWLARADGTGNQRLTSFTGQDGSPMWSPDGHWLYYVSEQFGPSNLCRLNLLVPTVAEQITKHSDAEAVRRARMSRDGKWIVYESGPDIMVCSLREKKPECRKVAIEAYADDRTNPESLATFTSGATEYAVNPSETFIAFVVHGELFLVNTQTGGKARRLTEHPGNDKSPAWSPDGKKLAFVSDRAGEDHLYLLEHNDPDHPELTKAHAFKAVQLTKGTVHDENPTFSPDGKQVLFLRNGRLHTIGVDGKNEKVLADDPIITGFEFTPDGKWIAYSRMDGNFASEIYLMPVAGGAPTNLTRYATRNYGPSFSRDGKRMAFLSQRRNDVDVFVLNLQKPVKEGTTGKDHAIDLEDVHLRAQQVTAFSTDEFEAVISPDGQQVAFRSTNGGDDLWIAPVAGGSFTRVTTGNQSPTQLFWSKTGNLYFLDGSGALRRHFAGGSAFPLPKGGDRTPFVAKMKIDQPELYRELFDECWRLLQHRFYDAQLHGADWIAVRERYRPLVKHVAMHEDFYDLISLMLGELNASHLGIGGRQRGPELQTAELGLLYDLSYKGPGLKIAEILNNGPADQKGIDLKAGQFILKIDRVELTDQVNLSELLADKVGEIVTLEVAADPKNPKRTKVEVRAGSRGQFQELIYRRWVARNAAKVSELSGGRYAYIHLRGMDLPSLDEFVRSLYSDAYDKEGLVLDVRNNGGGFTHDKVLNYLGGKEHTRFIARQGVQGTVMRENDRKWTKPIVLLINNRSYSDAEIFPSAFKTLGLGKLVGVPTGGYVIATNQTRLLDGSIFRMPMFGVFTAAGINMDKQGVQPDVLVEQHPDDLAQGKDAQLGKAVEVLDKDVDDWKKQRIGRPTLAEKKAEPAPKVPANGPGGQ